MTHDSRPWRWIPTLYFGQGLPYVVVMTLVGGDVQEPRRLQHRDRALHELALPAVGHQAAVEAAGRPARHQAPLDRGAAVHPRRGAGAWSR